jgi:hypothetical protein
MAKAGQEAIIFRRYVVPSLSFQEQARRGTVPEEAIPLFETMVRLGFNVAFVGAVRTAKTTFLSTWQALEDPVLEGVMVETDPEIPMDKLLPGAPILQLLADGEELQKIADSHAYPDYNINILRDGDVIELGNHTLEIISIGAHSPGSIAILDKTERILYSGDEIAQLNDNHYKEDPLKAEDSRYIHRGALNWDDAKKRKTAGTKEHAMFTALRQLEKIRAEHPVFHGAADIWLTETWNNRVLGIGRYYKGEKLIALFNFGNTPETAWINEHEDYVNLMTGEAQPAKDVGLPAYGFAWLMTRYQ